MDKFVEDILNELKKLSVDPLVFPGFLINIPDTTIVIALNRINDKVFFVSTSENGVIMATESFFDINLAVNGFFNRIKDISAQVARKKNEKFS